MTKPHHNLGRKYNTRPRLNDFAASKKAEEGWMAQRGSIPTPVSLNQILLGDPVPGRSALDKVQNDKNI